jgi:predicted MFS family arabinose efflux permease
VLLAGRTILGAAESFIITGAAAWGLAISGPQQAGRVIAWVGMAMFAAMALGAPLGMALYAAGGFAAVAIATVIIPLLTLLVVAPLPPAAVLKAVPSGLLQVVSAVWLPGFGAALSSVGYGAVLAFGALLAHEGGWSPV